MFGEKLSRALDGVSDLQLESAMGVYERKKRIKHIWLRVILALLALGVVLFLLQGTASEWISNLNLSRQDYSKDAPQILLPEATPIGVECYSWHINEPGTGPVDITVNGELVEKLADSIRQLHLTGIRRPQTYGFAHLNFLYEECDAVRLTISWDTDGHFYICPYDGYTCHYELVDVQADELMLIISQMLVQAA